MKYRWSLLVLVWLSFSVAADKLPALSCLVNPSKVVDIASPVSGVVEKLYVKQGDQLKKGQKILRLNADLEQVAVKSAKNQVDFFTRKIRRNQDLLKQNLISAHEQDELEMELHQAQLKLNEMQAGLALKTIKSPLSGVVHQKLIEEGELVTQQPVLQVIQLNPLYVEVVLPQSYYGQLHKGHLLFFKTLPDQQAFEGQLLVKDAMIDAASETFSIRVEVENADHALVAGIKCDVYY